MNDKITNAIEGINALIIDSVLCNDTRTITRLNNIKRYLMTLNV